jgi:ATP-dependent exoDNAse (exonuclease V) beta subunit
MSTTNLHFISAGAGSGKTYRLTQILCEELTSGLAQPAGVIATTFTKKAATELRERVREHLLKDGKFSLANAMGQARIGTVNSVCGSFLERFAFEAGLSTEQQVLEESQSALLIKAAIDEATGSAEVATLNNLAQRFGLEDWQLSLKGLVDKARANDIGIDLLAGMAEVNAEAMLKHFPKAAGEDLDASMLALIRHSLVELKPAVEASGKKNSLGYLEQLQEFQRKLEGGHVAWSEWVALSKAAPEVKLKPLIEPISEMADRYDRHVRLHDDIRQFLRLMFSLAAQTLHHYANRKRELGVLDFADQEHLLLNLLDEPEVSAALAEELDLLLVDEFQDTSPIQLALFMKLSRLAKQTYWVGDIKQAIYGFRGSDTQLMEAIIKALPALGGDKAILDSSWRSRVPLVNLVNDVFTKAFADSLEAEEVILKPQRDEVLKNAAFAHWMLAGKNKGLRGDALAEGVHRLHSSGRLVVDKERKQARPVRFSDIAILSRSHSGIQEIASSLRARNIPVATAQAGLLSTPEAVLALACLRRLNDSGDTIATAEIISLADCATPETWVADRLQYLNAKGDKTRWREVGDTAHPILKSIADLRTALPLLAPREALQTVVIRCDLSRLVLQWQTDANVARQRLANLEALLTMAESYEDSCRSTQRAATISGLILWLNAEAAAEQDSRAEPDVEAVKVLTHHAAKGLEWPVVILTDLNADIRDRTWDITATASSGIDVHNPLKDRFIRYWPWPFGKQSTGISVADSIGLSEEAKTFQREAREEAKRLLYVSMTRARDLLIFALADRDKERPWLDAVTPNSLLPDTAESTVLQLFTGDTLEYEQWALEVADPDSTGSTTGAVDDALQWFITPPVISRLPLNFSASGAEAVACKVVESVQIGERIIIANKPDMSVLGTALHACIGASFTDEKAPLDEPEMGRILAGFDVLEHLAPIHALRQTAALKKWIGNRWPQAHAMAEVPIELSFSNGQQMLGRIDLLLELPEGWVLIDHKSSQLSSEKWQDLAMQYSGQLAAYSKAVERVTGKPVLEKWFYFPVAGGAVRVEIHNG